SRWIAEHLDSLGIPTAYVRDRRLVAHKGLAQATSGLWRCSRIRYLLHNPTYMGQYEFGRRSRRNGERIARGCPAIVDEALWRRAQQTLSANLRFSPRNSRRKYLLRGLIKCAHCGLTYIGSTHRSQKGGEQVQYICSGKHQG